MLNPLRENKMMPCLDCASDPLAKPTRNRKNLQPYREMPCAACGHMPPSDPHHIKTRGAGGTDDGWNIVSLCRAHHIQWHSMGPSKMLELYPRLGPVLKARGWTLLPTGKLARIQP